MNVQPTFMRRVRCGVREAPSNASAGVLRLDLDKESYERAGLQGSPTRDGGRKHVKARFGGWSSKVLRAELM